MKLDEYQIHLYAKKNSSVTDFMNNSVKTI